MRPNEKVRPEDPSPPNVIACLRVSGSPQYYMSSAEDTPNVKDVSDGQPASCESTEGKKTSTETTGFKYWSTLEKDKTYWSERKERYTSIAPDHYSTPRSDTFGQRWVGIERKRQKEVFDALGTTKLDFGVGKFLRNAVASIIENHCIESSVSKESDSELKKQIEYLETLCQNLERVIQTSATALQNERKTHAATQSFLTKALSSIRAVATAVNGPGLAPGTAPPSQVQSQVSGMTAPKQSNEATRNTTAGDNTSQKQPSGRP